LAVGTVVWLASELLFFSGLFAAYYALRAQSTRWPPHGVDLDVVSSCVGTGILVASSGTMQLAVKAIKGGDRLGYLRWLAVTFLMGTVFLVVQLRDYQRLTFGIGTHAYGSAFYLMTGVHGLHVAAGLAAMLVVAGRASNTSFGTPDIPSVEMLSYYWHFVDVVWIGLWLTIFFVR
jgi:cytochrome c oxidase subunit 3